MSYVENDSVSKKVNHILQEALSSCMITDLDAEMLKKLLPKLKVLPDAYKENVRLGSHNNDWDIWDDEQNIKKRKQQFADIQRKFSNWLLMQYMIYQKQSNDNVTVKSKLSLKEKKTIKIKGMHRKTY